MKEKKNKRGKKPNKMKLVVCTVVVALIVYFGVSAIKIIKLNQERENVLAYNKELAQKKENLQLKLENINSPDYMESLARSDLKLIKPNELLFIFPEKEYAEDTETDKQE